MVRLGPGQFTGEVGALAGQPAMVSIRAAAPSDVIEIGRDQLLRIVQTDSELSDVLMRAFLLRRFELVAQPPQRCLPRRIEPLSRHAAHP